MAETLDRLWQHWGEILLTSIPRIVQAVLVLVVVLFVDDRAQRVMEREVAQRSGQRELARLLGRMARIAVLVIGVVIVLGIFQQTNLVASFIASLGVAGLVIAFALQDITKNFAAGVLLLIQRPFRLDDRIRVKDFEGTVVDITLRATALRTADGDEVLIPNADVYSGAITNLTRYPQRRITVPFTLPPGVDVDGVLSSILEEINATPALSTHSPTTPAPDIVITSVNKDGLQCLARVWVPANTDASLFSSAMNRRLQTALGAIYKQVAAST